MDQIQRQFVADAQEIVEKLDRDLDELRTVRLLGPKRRELAARIFRRVHTLKGSAASLGLKTLSQVAHECESVLDGVRLGRITIDESMLNALEEATNLIARSLERPASPPKADAKIVIARLHGIANVSITQGQIANTLRTTLPAEIAQSLSEYDLQHAREAVREGARLFIVSAGFAISDFDQNFRELSKLLGQTGEVIATVPGESASPDEIGFQLLYATDVVAHNLARHAKKLGHVSFHKLEVTYDPTPRQYSTPKIVHKPTPEHSASLRIDLNQLNRLIADASELFRETTQALTAASSLENLEVVETARRHLRRRFVEFEENLIKLRLVRLAELLERTAARAGRVAARQLGKEIEFEIVGGDVEVDKSLADTIGEPLMHLVRNAVGHGIESPDERVAAGKNPIGKVRIAAHSEGCRIHISISDDGRGLDLDRIAAAAGEHGIVGHEALSMDQCLRLIFRPGFSTAAEVSDLSGRGIGLDVVDRAMTQAGGEVRVRTEPGRGTTFRIVMPAALALVNCLLIRSREQFYAIELSKIVDRGSISRQELEAAVHAGSLGWKGNTLPIFNLRSLLSTELENGLDETSQIILCHTNNGGPDSGQHMIAVAIDSISGEHQTLVRSLGRYASLWKGISGATELTDGNVALVLDLEELLGPSL